MLHYTKQKITLLFSVLVLAATTAHAQKEQRLQPVWWFGESGAANFNFYRGTTQVLNDNLTVPAAFHKGKGVRPYASLLTEYRPGKVWGGMLNIAYDNRGGKFKDVIAPCNCIATLSTNTSYIAIEPSLRIAPFANSFYIFGGPTVSFNINKSFTYTQEKQADLRGEWSGIHKTLLSAQAGAGIDIPLSSKTNTTQVMLSPFVSFLTDFGHVPRSIESWSVYTIRTGVALKFGMVKKTATKTPIAETQAAPATVTEKEVQFSVRAPKVVPLNRQVKETFPLRNSVFFDQSSAAIPDRYVQLNKTTAVSFKENQLQESQPDNLNNGRSARQLAVYHNILNIIGDRMRANPASTIALTGASNKNPSEGKIMAENIRQYLVTVFGIDGARISTEGRDKPVIPSEQPGAVNELALLREGDRRVDITSTSPEMLTQVGGSTAGFLKPVEITTVQSDPLDSHVLFNVAGANDAFDSWSVAVKDEQGNVQNYGPYTSDQASIAGKTILGNNPQGNYTIAMTGHTKTGRTVTKESSVSLMKMDDPKQEGLRYSILFDFDKSKSIATYEKFLTDIVSPLIADNGTVIIHGHTDIIGDEKYNRSLSQNRATDARQILERALSNTGKKGVKFESFGFGEDAALAPFENTLPEERFYNRTVIIDIIPAK
ncbi:OmpA family protein [Ferruginibacter paludis]|uniref:OmpA family protein n=1 Tax=Ferruginibacter paludis TaxID=1310417 RepID=UPI0025B4A240|nr:OmpA family protein [Ferruginibacter paludis]MDN3657248.1 OmpA family protein [Ferruginibacter paludis]